MLGAPRVLDNFIQCNGAIFDKPGLGSVFFRGRLDRPILAAQNSPMGFFRFRKRIKVMPGVWFNLSKRGVSTSFGGKGLTLNEKNGKIRTTVGLPGTGLSYSSTSTGQESQDPAKRVTHPILWILLVIVVMAYLLGM